MGVIEDYLKNFEKLSTIRNYRRRLNVYFELINADPEKYFKQKRDYNKDFTTYLEKIQHMQPTTKKSIINSTKRFLEDNHVNINDVFSDPLKRKIKRNTKKCRPSTQDIVSTPNELKQILQHGETKARALFLIASSSGMRISEILQLIEEDIPSIKKHREGKQINFPIKVYIRGETTKTDQARYTFISNEAWDALLAWLKERPEYINQAIKKSIREKWGEDPTIFCFSYPVTDRIWKRLLKKSGYTERDKTTDRYRRHIHTLRKYFRIYLAPKATSDIAELLMGHEDSLGNVYRDRYPESKIAELYLKAMPDISVFETSADERIVEFDKQMKEKDREIVDLKKQMMELKAEVTEIRLKRLEEKNGIKK